MALNLQGFLRIAAEVTGMPAIDKLANGIANVDTKGTGAAKAMGYLKAAVAALAVGAVIKNVIELGDALKTVSDRTGISVENLSKFQGAADKAGTGLEAVAKGVTKLNKAIASGDENSRTLKSLGVDAKDGSEAMLQLAEVFRKTEDPALKSALAVKLFGKGGAELIPVLQDGRKAIEDQASVMSTEFAEAADGFNDRMTDIKRGSQSLVTDAVQPSLIALNDIIDAFKEINIEGAGVGKIFSEVLATALRSVAAIVLTVIDRFKQVFYLVEAIGASAKTIASGDFDFSGVFDNYSKKAEESAKDTREKIKKIFENDYFFGDPSKKDAPEPVAKSSPRAIKPEDVKEPGAADKWLDKVRAETDAIRQRASMIGMSNTEQEISNELMKIGAAGAEAKARTDEIATAKAERRKAVESLRAAQFQEDLRNEKRALDMEIQGIDDQTAALTLSNRQQEIASINRKYDNKLKQESIGLTDQEIEQKRKMLDVERELEISAKTRQQEVARDWRTGAVQAVNEYVEAATNAAESTKQVLGSVFKGMEDVMVDFITTGKANFKQFASDIIKEILRIYIRQQLIAPILNSIGSSFGGGGSVGGARALGGAVAGGSSYLVGENGPEIFTPAQSGRVTANDKMGGGSSVNVTVNVSSDGSTSSSGDGGDASKLGKIIAGAVQAEIIKQKRQGGLLA